MRFRRGHDYQAVFSLSPAPSNASLRLALESIGFVGVQVWNLDDAEDESGTPGNRDRLRDDFGGLADIPDATHWAIGEYQGDDDAEHPIPPGVITLRDAGGGATPPPKKGGTTPTPTPAKPAKVDPEFLDFCHAWRDGTTKIETLDPSDGSEELRASCRKALGLPPTWNPGDAIPLPKPKTPAPPAKTPATPPAKTPAKRAGMKPSTIVAVSALVLGALAIAGGAVWWAQKNAKKKRRKALAA